MATSTPTQAERKETPGLATMSESGRRIWLKPRLSKGRFLTARRVVGWALIALFVALPYIRIDGQPSILLDIPAREFHLFGATFLPTDTLLLAIFIVGVFVSVFLVTSLFGRVWCGWACPQTVYLEFVYRPIERILDGTVGRGGRARNTGGGRRAVKFAVYLVVSLFLAHIFLAYFVGVDRLAQWVRQSPLEHPVPFMVMAITTGLIMFDFGFWREQMCTLACPYARFQSVMLDRDSLIVSYDPNRGEPRGPLKRRPKNDPETGDVRLETLPDDGDCIDCKMCVTTCPTGIDIREGLQMECVGCAQCIDACDNVMDKIGRPRGLIRYSTQAAIEGGKSRVLRPRVAIYAVLLAALTTAFGFTLATKQPTDVTLLRGQGLPYMVLDGGRIANQVRVKIVNRLKDPVDYTVSIASPESVVLLGAPEGVEMTVEGGGGTETQAVSVSAPREAFNNGELIMTLRVEGGGFAKDVDYRLIGPQSAPTANEPAGAADGDEEPE